MNLRKRILAASVAALPLFASGQLGAASPKPPGPLAGTMMAAPVALSAQKAAVLQAKLNALRPKYGLDKDHGLKLAAQHPGAVGTRVTRFAHTYKSVRIFQSESVVVTDDDENILSETAADRRNGLGKGESSAALGGRYANFDVTPSLLPKAAIDVAAKTTVKTATFAAPPSAELVIYPVVRRVRVPEAANKSEAQLNAMDLVDEVSGYELAYLVQTRLVSAGRPVYHDTIVSARDGRVLAQWNALMTDVGVGKSQYNGSVPINTTQANGTFTMRDPARGVNGRFGGNAITDANHGTSPGPIYSNSTNSWGDGLQYNGGATTSVNGQTAAVNAAWGLMNTYDTLKNVLGWQSLDGQNTATYINAHVYTNYDNAFYDDGCKCMYIGDGGSYFYSLGSIDVIGHEMGHGVTAATSNLTYAGESGGLNESASDINGEMTEAYARNGGTGDVIPATGNDWMMGKEISRSSAPLRWLYKPSKDGMSPDAWSSTVGNLDVHYSSGPNNRMFYFLSQGSSADTGSDYYSRFLTKSPAAMTGIGNDKAYRIWFRALTTKFTSSTNYADARNKVLLAAQELYGAGSKEAIAVQRAYAAINVGADVDETPAPSGPVSIGTHPQGATVTIGGTATFSVTAAGGTPPYRYQWMRNGADIASATSSSYSLTAQESDNGARFAAKVGDSANPPTSATSNDATLTVSTRNPTDIVYNGSFEYGATGWAGTTGVIGAWPGHSQVAYDGTYFAYMGGNGRRATETLSQSVIIPAAAMSVQLSFALHIDTAEINRGVAYDTLTVTVKSKTGSVLQTLATYSNLNAASGYQIRTFDLSQFRGQAVVLSFAMSEDTSLQTTFAVDKIVLMTQ